MQLNLGSLFKRWRRPAGGGSSTIAPIIKPETADAPSGMTVLVFLNERAATPAQATIQAIVSAFPEAGIALSQQQAYPFVFDSEGFLSTVLEIDAPAPIHEADPQFSNAWFWPSAWDELSKHQSHLIVSVTGGSDAKKRALKLQQLLAAILSVERSAVGVCDMFSGTLLPAKAVALGEAGNQHEIFLPLFISCFFAREPDGQFAAPSIFCSAKGLATFGLKEVEVRGFTGERSELYKFVIGFCRYVLDSPRPIKDGDTIGTDATQKIKVKIQKSYFYDDSVHCVYFQ